MTTTMARRRNSGPCSCPSRMVRCPSSSAAPVRTSLNTTYSSTRLWASAPTRRARAPRSRRSVCRRRLHRHPRPRKWGHLLPTRRLRALLSGAPSRRCHVCCRRVPALPPRTWHALGTPDPRPSRPASWMHRLVGLRLRRLVARRLCRRRRLLCRLCRVRRLFTRAQHLCLSASTGAAATVVPRVRLMSCRQVVPRVRLMSCRPTPACVARSTTTRRWVRLLHRRLPCVWSPAVPPTSRRRPRGTNRSVALRGASRLGCMVAAVRLLRRRQVAVTMRATVGRAPQSSPAWPCSSVLPSSYAALAARSTWLVAPASCASPGTCTSSTTTTMTRSRRTTLLRRRRVRSIWLCASSKSTASPSVCSSGSCSSFTMSALSRGGRAAFVVLRPL